MEPAYTSKADTTSGFGFGASWQAASSEETSFASWVAKHLFRGMPSAAHKNSSIAAAFKGRNSELCCLFSSLATEASIAGFAFSFSFGLGSVWVILFLSLSYRKIGGPWA